MTNWWNSEKKSCKKSEKKVDSTHKPNSLPISNDDFDSICGLRFFFCSLSVGPAGIDALTVLKSLFSNETNATQIIVQEIRLPRAILGFAIGATLGVCGAALQGYVRNPLAEPGLIGVSSSAAFGAVLTIYYGLSAVYMWALPIGGMVGASVGVAIMLLIAGRESSTLSLILAGVAISTLAGALTSLALNLAPDPYSSLEIVFWLLGSLANRSFDHIWLAGPFIVVGLLLVLTLGRASGLIDSW